MRKLLLRICFLLILVFSFESSAQMFSFIRCSPAEKGAIAPTCKLCLSPSNGSADSICSANYSTNPGANDPTPGISNISRELTEDLGRKLARIKKLPKEGFDVREFYEKYADFAPEEAEKELEWIDKQIDFLKWKKAQIKKIQASKKKN